jgi:hypothetical protein
VCVNKAFDLNGPDPFVNATTEQVAADGTLFRKVCASGLGGRSFACIGEPVSPEFPCVPRATARKLGVLSSSQTNFTVPVTSVDVATDVVKDAFNGKFAVTASTVDVDQVYHFGRSSFVGGLVGESANMYLMKTTAQSGQLADPVYFGGCTGGGGCTETTTAADVIWVDQASAVPLFAESRAIVTNTGSVEKIPGVGFGDSDQWVMMYGGRWPDTFLHGVGKFNFPSLTADVIKDATEGVQLRTAPNPWGPWSAPVTVYSLFSEFTPGYCQLAYKSPFLDALDCGADFAQNESLRDGKNDNGAEYGIGILKLFTEQTNGGAWIYWTMSTWNPYRVYVMRTFVDMDALSLRFEPLTLAYAKLNQQFLDLSNQFIRNAIGAL